MDDLRLVALLCTRLCHDLVGPVGAVLRSRAGVKPIYVSCGHRVSLETAVDLVMRCTTRYRLPETTRWADRAASGR
jgi:deoxyribonuclease V